MHRLLCKTFILAILPQHALADVKLKHNAYCSRANVASLCLLTPSLALSCIADTSSELSELKHPILYSLVEKKSFPGRYMSPKVSVIFVSLVHKSLPRCYTTSAVTATPEIE